MEAITFFLTYKKHDICFLKHTGDVFKLLSAVDAL